MKRWLVNVFWREVGHPRLPMTETWCGLVATDADRVGTARRLVQQVRQSVAGAYRIQVRFSPYPEEVAA